MKKDPYVRRRVGDVIVPVIGTIVALGLVGLVLYIANTDIARGFGAGASKVQTLKQIVKSGDTIWEYREMDSFPLVDKTGKKWTEAEYQAENWKAGKGTFGSVGGVLSPRVNGAEPDNLLDFYMDDNTAYPVTYFRTEFELGDISEISTFSGEIEYDDAVVVYLNGKVVHKGNVPDMGYLEGNLYGSVETVEKSRKDVFKLEDLSVLQTGRNCLAVEIHQNSANSSDIYFDFTVLRGVTGECHPAIFDTSGLMLQVGDTKESIWINWMTFHDGDFVVQYCEEGETYGDFQDVELKQVQVEDQFCYQAQISWLEYGETYHYRFWDHISGCYSEEFTINIPEEDEDITFLFAGDAQIGAGGLVTEDADKWQKALEAGLLYEPDSSFVISAGDQADDSEVVRSLQEYRGFRGAEVLKHLPIAVNQGNHDTTAELYDLQFDIFEKRSGHNYYFMYEDILFAAINTNSREYEENLTYLKNAVAKCRPEWIVVMMHYSMYSAGPHAYDDRIAELREVYAEAFAELEVDIVLSGHDHVYTRSYFMDGMEVTEKEDGEKKTGEVLYISGGSSTGSKMYEAEAKEEEYVAFCDDREESTPLISAITISGRTLTLETICVETGAVLDTCTINKTA